MAYRPMGLERAVKAYFDPIDEERKRAARVRDQMFLQMGARRGLVAGQKDIAEHAAQIREGERLAAAERAEPGQRLMRRAMLLRTPPSPTDPRYSVDFEYMDKTPKQLADIDRQDRLLRFKKRVREYEGPLTTAQLKYLDDTFTPAQKYFKLGPRDRLVGVNPKTGLSNVITKRVDNPKPTDPLGKILHALDKSPPGSRAYKRYTIELEKLKYGPARYLPILALKKFGRGEYEDIDPSLWDSTHFDIATRANRVVNALGFTVTEGPPYRQPKNPFLTLYRLTPEEIGKTDGRDGFTVRQMIRRKMGYNVFMGLKIESRKTKDVGMINNTIGILKKIKKDGIEAHKGIKHWEDLDAMGEGLRTDLLNHLIRVKATLEKQRKKQEASGRW